MRNHYFVFLFPVFLPLFCVFFTVCFVLLLFCFEKAWEFLNTPSVSEHPSRESVRIVSPYFVALWNCAVGGSRVRSGEQCATPGG